MLPHQTNHPGTLTICSFFTGLKEKLLISSHLDIGKYRGMVSRVERVLIGHNDISFSGGSVLRADVIYRLLSRVACHASVEESVFASDRVAVP